MNNIRTVFAVALLMAAASGWAPINLPGEGGPVLPPATEEQLAQQQMNYQGTLPTVGEVPEVTSLGHVPDVRSDPEASSVVASTMENDPVAAEIVKQAGEAKPARNPGGSFLLGFLFLCLGIGSVWGVRAWVGRQVPPMPTSSNKTKW